MVDLIDQTESVSPNSPWVEGLRSRMRSLLAECRCRASLLIDTPASTCEDFGAKCQALLRYWEVDVDCDPRAYKVLASVCADVNQLAALMGQAPANDTQQGPPEHVGSSSQRVLRGEG
jgi:hypothetical protein